MNLVAYFLVIFAATIVNAQINWQKVNNTCTQIPTKGRIDQVVGKWTIYYWTNVAKCATLTVTKNPNNATYILQFKYYSITDENYLNPKTDIFTVVIDPENPGICQTIKENGKNSLVVGINVFTQNGFAAITCEAKDGDVPPISGGVYANSKADSITIDIIKYELKRLSNLNLNKIYQGPDCKTF
ncbi:hypothetical protein CHUAL_000197 [Chamberlinius hualienensis]